MPLHIRAAIDDGSSLIFGYSNFKESARYIHNGKVSQWGKEEGVKLDVFLKTFSLLMKEKNEKLGVDPPNKVNRQAKP